ncbi:MAG: hypothetical protein WC852_07125 [Candidatus Nanoarchaeia archaeon]|jgi:hypothetical protein
MTRKVPKSAYAIKGKIDSDILFYAGHVINRYRKVFENLAK